MLGREEKREERGEVSCKLTAGLDTRPRNTVRETSGSYINCKELTIIWVG